MKFVYTTFPDVMMAKSISAELLNRSLIACANIFPAHIAMYKWDGAVQQDDEIAVIYKTSGDKLNDLEKTYVELHPYDVPCFVAIDVDDGHEPFMKWVQTEVK